MLGIGVAPYVLLGLMVFVMPESPRWLVMIHEELKMAASVSLWRGHLLAQCVVASEGIGVLVSRRLRKARPVKGKG